MESQNTVRTVSFRIASEKVEALDTIARAMDRDRSYLLNEVIDGYLDEQRRFTALVEEGVLASEQGKLIEDEDVLRLIDSWPTKHDGDKNAKTKTQVGA